ncbi:Vacuolar protein sorting-associated protein 9A [Stylosanthes scabra]|nr:Vacuolar protein sorting-associated protein 9A [Stylosanthes scabra]
MTKLFSRTFAASPEDSRTDNDISEKICLLQTFLKPEHLDIPALLRNEASWLLAQKELRKINGFKSPREKLLCIMNCCRVINNLLLNATISENHVPAGADDFLPVLIYVTIKANPPQLHSNLKFIQLYRWQAKLVSEAAYYFTNLVSAMAFIVDLNATSLSMDEEKFEECMEAAKLMSQQTEAKCSSSGKMCDKTEETKG